MSITPDQADKEKYLKMITDSYLEGQPGEVKSMLPRIVTTGYQALNLIYYFTAGPDEVRAWTLRRYTKAP